MNIINWNVRELGLPSKRFLVKDFLQLHYADICCIQESKLSTVDPTIWRLVGGSCLDLFSYTPALGTAAGMIVGWNNSLVEGTITHQGIFCLSIEFRNRSNNVLWVYTSVYGPNARHLKKDLRNKLRNCRPELGVPWVICDDFNSIFTHLDKLSGIPNHEDIRLA